MSLLCLPTILIITPGKHAIPFPPGYEKLIMLSTHLYVSHICTTFQLCKRINCWTYCKLLKEAKLKFWFGHFQNFVITPSSILRQRQYCAQICFVHSLCGLNSIIIFWLTICKSLKFSFPRGNGIAGVYQA